MTARQEHLRDIRLLLHQFECEKIIMQANGKPSTNLLALLRHLVGSDEHLTRISGKGTKTSLTRKISQLISLLKKSEKLVSKFRERDAEVYTAARKKLTAMMIGILIE